MTPTHSKMLNDASNKAQYAHNRMANVSTTLSELLNDPDLDLPEARVNDIVLSLGLIEEASTMQMEAIDLVDIVHAAQD